MKTAVISLGGSIIVQKKIDVSFLKKLKKLVLNHIKKGNRVIIVCGGGRPCRIYQKTAEKLTKANSIDKDWIGIMATRLNAELVRVMFKEYAYPKVVYDPHDKIRTTKKIIIGAGYEPGCSTDYDTVLLAKQFKADMIINASNIDYVYDKDPAKHRNAMKIKEISWAEYKKLIGGKFKPGMHAPFDPVASILAQKCRMKVAIVNGRKLGNLKKLLSGKKFAGSVIG